MSQAIGEVVNFDGKVLNIGLSKNVIAYDRRVARMVWAGWEEDVKALGRVREVDVDSDRTLGQGSRSPHVEAH